MTSPPRRKVASAVPDPGPLRIVYTPLDLVLRWPRNPKKHKTDLIRDSFTEHGFTIPLVKDSTTGRLVAGHGRLDALVAMRAEGLPPPKRIIVKAGQWHVPVLEGVDFPDEASAEDYLISDNRLVELGGWNPGMLLEFDHDALLSAGWTPGEIKRLVVEQNAFPGTTDNLPGGNAGAIRQVVLYLPSAEFELALGRLDGLMTTYGVENHTEVFLKLLEFYEAKN